MKPTDNYQLLQLHIPTEEFVYRQGEIVASHKQEHQHVYEIGSGLVKIYTMTKSGRQSIQLILGAGDLFPLSWLIDKKLLLNYYIEAVTDVRLRRFNRQDFLQAVETDQAVAMHLIRKLTLQVNVYASRIDNLVFKYARQRVAYRILYLGQRFGVTTNQGRELPPFNNQDIGRAVNLSRESVNRELSRFTKLGYIRMRGNIIILLDEAALHAAVGTTDMPLYIDDFGMF